LLRRNLSPNGAPTATPGVRGTSGSPAQQHRATVFMKEDLIDTRLNRRAMLAWRIRRAVS
jgi:hypothetical protein